MYNAVLFIHWLACRVKVFDLAGTVTQKFAKRPPAIALNNNGPLSLSVGKIPRLVRVTTTTTTTSRSIFRIHRRVRHLEDEKRREEETTTTEMTIERRRDVCAHESDSGRVRTGSPISTPSVHSATQPRVRSTYAARLMHSNDIHSWRGDASAFDKLTPRIEWLSVVFVPADRAPRSSLPPRLRLPTRN